MAYDPKKAAVANQLIQSGTDPDIAMAQAGVSGDDIYNYNLGSNGRVGALVMFPLSAAEKANAATNAAEAAAAQAAATKSNQGLQSANYPQTPSGNPAQQPSTKTTSYTTTSTTEVSGGGTTNTVDGELQDTPASRALQPAINAKQAELEQFNRENPNTLIRKKQGLPPLTPEETQRRNDQEAALTREKLALTSQQQSAQVLGPPSITTTPNTTTTNTTVITGVRSVDTPVQSPGGSDPAINQQTETNLGVTVGASNVQAAPGAVGDAALQATEDAQDQESQGLL